MASKLKPPSAASTQNGANGTSGLSSYPVRLSFSPDDGSYTRNASQPVEQPQSAAAPERKEGGKRVGTAAEPAGSTNGEDAMDVGMFIDEEVGIHMSQRFHITTSVQQHRC